MAFTRPVVIATASQPTRPGRTGILHRQLPQCTLTLCVSTTPGHTSATR